MRGLTERYKRPSFVLTEVEGGLLKGSGRSFGEFNLALALGECQDLLIAGGGHAAACGVTIKVKDFAEFKARVENYYKGLKLKDQERFLDCREDLRLTEVGELDLELIEELQKLEPFGEGNPEPVFLLSEMMILDATKMGAEEQHLRLLVRDKTGKTMKLVAFFAEKEWLQIVPGERVDVWVNLTENEWNGIRSVEGRILKIGLCFEG